MLPSHVLAISHTRKAPTRTDRLRTQFTRVLRHRYAQSLAWTLRHWVLLCIVVLSLIAGAAAAMATGLIRVQFFAFDPMRIFYVNVDMPAGSPLDATLARVAGIETEVRENMKEGEVRRIASLAGAKFTDAEALFGDVYGQVIVSLLPRGGRRTRGRRHRGWHARRRHRDARRRHARASPSFPAGRRCRSRSRYASAATICPSCGPPPPR
jgi:multidrug efflux pump subunit AcrB